jgi:hypothetical protein
MLTTMHPHFKDFRFHWFVCFNGTQYSLTVSCDMKVNVYKQKIVFFLLANDIRVRQLERQSKGIELAIGIKTT